MLARLRVGDRFRGEGITPNRRPLAKSRLNGQVLLGLLILAIGTIGGYLWLDQQGDKRPVLVAARDLPAGAVLSPADLLTAQVGIDEAIYRAALPADDLSVVLNRTLSAPVYANFPIARSQLADRPVLAQGQVALTVAVKRETAAGGRLRPGDPVKVLVPLDAGKPTTDTLVVLERATVYDVGYDLLSTTLGAAGREDEEGPLAFITLALTREEALAVTKAKHNGAIDVAFLSRAER